MSELSYNKSKDKNAKVLTTILTKIIRIVLPSFGKYVMLIVNK